MLSVPLFILWLPKTSQFLYCHGDIRFNPHDGLKDITLQVTARNDLWYHSYIQIVRDTEYFDLPAPEDPFSHDESSDRLLHQLKLRINFLSDAAKFELWHLRLGHIGKEKLGGTHKHCNGVPKLRGNSFYKCPACLASKCTKNPV